MPQLLSAWFLAPCACMAVAAVPLDSVVVTVDRDWLHVAWLTFMLADIPRLLLRVGLSRKGLFFTGHRRQRHGLVRVVLQTLGQNVGYIVSLGIMYWLYRVPVIAVLLVVYACTQILKLTAKIRDRTAFDTSLQGHRYNDLVIKPLRMICLVAFAMTTCQPIWLIGLAIVFSKWIITRPYEKFFDVPILFQAIVVVSSAAVVFMVWPGEIGQMGVLPEALRTLYSTIASVYATVVGLLAAFLGIVVSRMADRTEDVRRYRYLSQGVVLNFTFTAVLILACLLGIVVSGGPSEDLLRLSANELFGTSSLNGSHDWIRYFVFGLSMTMSVQMSLIYTATTVVILEAFPGTHAYMPQYIRDFIERARRGRAE